MSVLGVAIGVWGLVTGVAMVKGGIPIPVALVMTFTAFAGSAQLAVLPLLALKTPLPVVWVTALLVTSGSRSFPRRRGTSSCGFPFINGCLPPISMATSGRRCF